MSEVRIPSQLRGPTSVDYEAVKRNGFHDQGILVVDVNDERLAWDEKQFLRNVGEKLFGRRKAGG